MKNSKRSGHGHAAKRRTRAFRAGVFACVVLGAGVVTAVASYPSLGVATPRPAQVGVPAAAAAKPSDGYVTVEVNGRKLQVNAKTLQQAPLSQEQSRQIADALRDNKSTEGLVEVRNADGSVSMDLQGRFQNVTIAKRNDDGSVSTACVDTPEGATSFLNQTEATPGTTGSERPGKGPVRQQ
jgi:ribosomal protein L25 (general stress protein Ctc)